MSRPVRMLAVLATLIPFALISPAAWGQDANKKLTRQIRDLEEGVANLRNQGTDTRTLDRALKEMRKLVARKKWHEVETLIEKTTKTVWETDQKALGSLNVRGQKVLSGVDPKKIFPRIELEMRRPLTSVVARPARQAKLDDEVPVLGLRVGREYRAYPVNLLTFYRTIHDKLGGKSIVILSDTYATSLVGFSRRARGKNLTFAPFGVYNSALLLRDEQTKSLWSAVTGEALVGPSVGSRLTPLPAVRTLWKNWRELVPTTTVVVPDTKSEKLMENNKRQARPRLGDASRTVVRTDNRQKPDRMGMGIQVGKERRFYPLLDLERSALVERVGEQPIAIFRLPGSTTALAYSARVGRRILVFDRVSSDTFRVTDRATGSTWDLNGHCRKGPLAGAHLIPVGGVIVRWQSWAATGETSLYRIDE